MSTQEIKAELLLDTADTGRFFRAFAEALEKGDDQGLTEFDLSIRESNKIKLDIKRRPASFEIKIKVKKALLPAPTEADKHPVKGKSSGYKGLKKRLESSFKDIKKQLQSGLLPTEDIVARFLTESAEMVSFPGYGDEYYPAYTAACQSFNKAAGDKNLAETLAAFNRLSELKSACHDRYK